MRFYYILFIFLVLTINCSAQTFSVITDPITGDNTSFDYNFAIEMKICQDKIILSGQHVCHPLIEGENGFLCGSLSSFDFEGNLLNAVLLDSFFHVNHGGLLTIDDRIFTANFKSLTPSISLGRKVYIQEFNQNLELVKQTAIPTRVNSIPNNDGIKYIKGHFYIHGNTFPNNGTRSMGFVQKLDTDLNLIWDKLYAHENAVNGCEFLQKTHDDLIYAHKYRGSPADPTNTGIQIVKLNTEGIKIDSLEIVGERGGGATGIFSLLSDTEGAIYVYTSAHPTDESIFEQSKGRINKYSNNLDTLIWSLKLPFNNYVDKRSYIIFDLKEAKNGDILACGTVFDEGPDGPIATSLNHTLNAFITRVSKEGEIKWLHLYRSPNINETLPVAEFGDFIPSAFENIEELEDGRIVAAGSYFLNDRQTSEIFLIGSNEPLSKFMLLVVDGETGCIDGEECDEIIILDGENRPRDNFLPVINSDYIWHIEKTTENGSIINNSYTYSEDSVFQNTNYYFERITDPESSTPMVVGYFREIGGRIYQKFDGNFNEKIVFDIHVEVGDSITVERENGPVVLHTLRTDTITFLDDVPRKRIILECTSELLDEIVWIEGIGELDDKVCSTNDQGELILCVQEKTGEPVYSLNDDICDTVISVRDLKSNIDLKIHPNPVNDRLYLETTDHNWTYQIINLQGQQMNAGQYQDHIEVSQLPSGIYFLQLQKDDELYQAIKFVKE